MGENENDKTNLEELCEKNIKHLEELSENDIKHENNSAHTHQ